MRPTALLPLLCAVASLVLSLLCVFAGSRRGFINDADILTLNVSQIGSFITSTVLPSLNIPGTIIDDVRLPDEFAGLVAERLGLPDFYAAHVLTYCEGDYSPNGTFPDASRNLTRCSNQTSTLDFDPARIIQSELPPGITLADLNWPSSVDVGIRALQAAWRAMFVTFVVGIIATALVLLTSAVGIFDDRRLTAGISSLFAVLAFLALGVASGIATAVAVKATDIINREGNRIGIAASRGNKFLAMTWSATAVMLVAAISWMCLCCIRPKKK